MSIKHRARHARTMERLKIIPLEGEEWRDLKEYEGIYKISNRGRLWSHPRRGGGGMIVIKLHGGCEYIGVTLSKETKRQKAYLHRMLAETFIPNPENLPIVDHIDRDKTNNKLDNLRWVTRSENGLNREAFGSIHKVITPRRDGTETITWNVCYTLSDGYKLTKKLKSEEAAREYLSKLQQTYPR